MSHFQEVTTIMRNRLPKSLQCVAFFCLLCGAMPSAADTQLTKNTLRRAENSPPAPGKLADVAWLTGQWSGTGLGGTCDENWSPPRAGNMVGTTRVFQNDKLLFSEFFMMTEQSGSLTLKLKHFGPDMTGWEEKDKFVEFQLIKVAGTTAWFDGLTYQLDAQGVLHVYVAMKQSEGYRELEFTFRPNKAKPSM